MTPRREALVFTCAVAAFWAFLLHQATVTPVLLDDWYQLTWHRHHDLGPASLWEYFHYNYFNFNPRIGDLLLLVVNGPPVFHLVLTPIAQLGLLWVAYAVVFGRWPRPTLRDLQLLLFIQVMIWLVIPIPGIIYFYRPFATNYLWAFAITLALFVPYRLALARLDDPPRHWLVPFMLVLGWISGMCNEHTGPTQMVAMAVFLYVAWRRSRLRPWMVAGAAGLYVGYPMLFFAPGQALRYAGMATRNTPVNLLAERGLDGTFEIILDFIGEAQLGTDLMVIGLLVYIATKQRRGEPLVALPRTVLVTAVALVLAAGAMIVTLFASPTIGERLFFAPAVLFVGALAVLVEHLFAERVTRRVVVGLCVVIFGYHVLRMIQVLRYGKQGNDARIAILEQAAPGTTPEVPPYAMWRRSRWWWGDDFQYASLREYVANEVYDLRNIAYDRHIHWAEPAPPDRYVVTRTYDPPLPPERSQQIAPVRYIPTFWEWTLVQFRRLRVLSDLDRVPGHSLVRYTVDVEGAAFTDPAKRPIRVFDWNRGTLTFVDGRPFDDRLGQAFVRIWRDSLPPRLTEAYVIGCGKQWQIELVPDLEDDLGPMAPITLDCRGTYSAILCEPELCWLSGRYWR
ncbi:MAG: hypothetical protein H0X17_01410 [Deltaproteobacteria bacterium]|nr:hypothetical protein [Deltaproteobacteria bacterium]